MITKEQLIKKLYQGDCSREELESLLNQLQQDTAEDYSGIMKKLWQELNTYPDLEEPAASIILDKTFEKIENREAGSGKETIRDASTPVRKLKRRQFLQKMSVAAALLVMAGLISWLWLGLEKTVEVRTAFGEQRSIELPDRSIVKLNANSSITFHKQWNSERTRRVWLEGEAYFEVRKNQKHRQKFQVITPDLTVEVLGTIFNVNTRKGATTVFLEEGEVNVDLQEAEEDILMAPGEMVIYSRKDRQSRKKKIVEEAPASWKDGTLLFQDKPLAEIIEKMEELYGITAVVENKTLLDRKFNVSMPVDNLETAYLLLKELTGFDIEKKENQLIIK